MWSACGFHIPTMNIFTRPEQRACSTPLYLLAWAPYFVKNWHLLSVFQTLQGVCICVCRWKIYCALHQWFSISWQRNILLIINISCYQLLPRCGPNAWPLMQHSWLCVIRHTWSLWRFITAAVKLCYESRRPKTAVWQNWRPLCNVLDFVHCLKSSFSTASWDISMLFHCDLLYTSLSLQQWSRNFSLMGFLEDMHVDINKIYAPWKTLPNVCAPLNRGEI